jgi:hypothetical protein
LQLPYSGRQGWRIHVPINKASPLGIAIPLGVPMLAVASLQAPLGELLLKVVKSLV